MFTTPQGQQICYGPHHDDTARTKEVERCQCGTLAWNNWFDRTICPEPCGGMHTRCKNCGAALDSCPFEEHPPTAHVYWSTACYHEQHDQCRQQCKFCPSRCTCSCHHTKEETNATG